MDRKIREIKNPKKKKDKLKIFVFSLVGLLVVLVGLLCFYEIQRISKQKEEMGFLPETGDFAATSVVADAPYIPRGMEVPEDFGWIYLGDGYSVTEFDLDRVDFKGAPKKVRFVMFLNGSIKTCGTAVGADPDGVTGVHTVGGQLSYGNSVYAYHVAPAGKRSNGDPCVNPWPCVYTFVNRVLGEPQNCGSTNQCGCSLGRDKHQQVKDASGGYVIIDMACNQLDPNAGFKKCISMEAEDHNQVIEADGTDAIDLIFYEVGESEHFYLYAYPYWIPPQVQVTKPGNCADNPTITITATDSISSQNIIKFWLYLNDDMSGPWVVTSDRSAVYLDSGGLNELGVVNPSFGEAGEAAWLTFSLSGLMEKYHGTDYVEVFAEAEDNEGRKSDKVSGGRFQTGLGPEVEIRGISYSGTDSIEISWAIVPVPSGYTLSNCKLKWSIKGSESWSEIPIGNCNDLIGSTEISGIDPYLAYEFSVEATTCTLGTAEDETAAPWLMTHLGDTYASLGYNLEMQDVNSENLGIPQDDAYFSHYLISTGGSNILLERKSRRGYELLSYLDTNKLEVESGIYDKLLSLAEASGACTIKDRSDLESSDGCGSVSIYFIGDGNSINLSGNWLKQLADPSRACIIVSKGRITVSAGDDQADDIDKMDVFLITEAQFETERDNEILLINGSVIADSVEFGRNLMQGNTDNPAEVIRYDPKYFDYFRECLGIDYPQKFREYKYSDTRSE